MVLSISEQSADRNLPTEYEPILRVEMDENAGTQTPTGVWSFKKTNGRLSFTEMYSQEGQEEISVLSSLPFLSSFSSLPFLSSQRDGLLHQGQALTLCPLQQQQHSSYQR